MDGSWGAGMGDSKGTDHEVEYVREVPGALECRDQGGAGTRPRL